MCYATFIEFLVDFGISDDILDAILITDKKLLRFKLSLIYGKSYMLTGFLKPVTNTGVSLSSITISLYYHFNSKARSH